MKAKEFVGCAPVKPLLQQVAKTSAGGMAAVSAGIVAFFMNGQQAESGVVLFALSLIVLSIPLLVGARIFFNIFDAYEYISSRAEKILESLFFCGFGTAFVGYELLLSLINQIVFWAFFAGMITAAVAIWLLGREIDLPQMQRRDQHSGA